MSRFVTSLVLVSVWTMLAAARELPTRDNGRNEPLAPEKEDTGAAATNDTRGLVLDNPGILPAAQLWPGGVVYFRFADRRLTCDQRQGILAAIISLQAATKNCITFVEDLPPYRTAGTILFFAYDDKAATANQRSKCESSSLGYEPDNLQTIVMSAGLCDGGNPKNFKGVAIHELMHAIGYIHEFSRTDREKWFKFKPFVTNQNYVLKSNTFDIPFNYQSITNYQFSNAIDETPNHPPSLGRPRNMGQLCKVSLGDLQMIEAAYYKECRKDKKPVTFTESFRIPLTDCGDYLPDMGEDFDMGGIRINLKPEENTSEDFGMGEGNPTK